MRTSGTSSGVFTSTTLTRPKLARPMRGISALSCSSMRTRLPNSARMVWIKPGIQFNASNANIESVATITIRGLDEAAKKRLRARAARHGRSMEEEAREILKIGVATSEREPNLYESIRALFEPLGGGGC